MNPVQVVAMGEITQELWLLVKQYSHCSSWLVRKEAWGTNTPSFHSTHPLNSYGCLPLAEYSSQKTSVGGTYVIPSKDLLSAESQSYKVMPEWEQPTSSD